MKTPLHSFLKKYFEAKALVLMYHRIAEPESDVWNIAVSPAHFEQHLQVLKKAGCVMPLPELIADLKNQSLRKKCLAITFDDGYADNYQVAKPLLEQYGLPATFFISSGNIGQAAEFWWDELEHIFLFMEPLPAEFSMAIGGEQIQSSLGGETRLNETLRQKHRHWKAFKTEAPSLRSALFLQLWQTLQPLPLSEIQKYLAHIRSWAGLAPASRPAFQSLSVAQLQELSRGTLFTIGAHTVSHVALGSQEPAVQRRELAENRNFLEAATNQAVNLLAYPYGNYNKSTLTIAAEEAFAAAFTTEHKPVKLSAPLFRLGRFQINNWAKNEFEANLKQWFTS